MIILALLIFMLVVGGAILFWQSSARDRELATRISKQMCDRHNVQFLDDTAMLDSFRLCRNDDRKLGFMRRYHFEFYNGNERLKGRVTVFHHEITELYLENPLPEVTNPRKRDLFNSANEVSNVIKFPGKSNEPHD